MLDLVQKMTGCSAHAAKRAWERLVADNPMMFAQMTADIVNSQEHLGNNTFFYESIDDALTARHERFGVPKCYVECKEIAPSFLSIDFPLNIFSVDITHCGNKRRCFMLACDIRSLGDDYTASLVTVVASMLSPYGNPSIKGNDGLWMDGGGTRNKFFIEKCVAVEWYDDEYQYHVTERGGQVGPNIYYFRRYYEY